MTATPPPRCLRSTLATALALSMLVAGVACSSSDSAISPELRNERFCTAAIALKQRSSAIANAKTVPAARRAVELTKVPLDQAVRNTPEAQKANFESAKKALAAFQKKLDAAKDGAPIDQVLASATKELADFQKPFQRIADYTLKTCPALRSAPSS